MNKFLQKNSKKSSILKLTFLVLFSLMLLEVSAEGSGTWGVTDTRQVNLFVSATGSNGGGNTGYVNRGFMLLPSSTSTYNPEHRLFVRVKPGETVYWGFQMTTSANVTFTWYYQNNHTGFYPTATTTGGTNGRVQVQAQSFNPSSAAQGRPATAAAAAAGPSALPGGSYNAYSFTNNTGVERTYWLETNTQNVEFNYWDITVASGNTRQPGRVYCKYWNTVNELPNSPGNSRSDNRNYPANFGFYIPVENTYTNQGYYVKRMMLPGSSGGYTVFFANPDGPRDNLDYIQNRRSIGAVSYNSHFPLFLSAPDASIWNSAPLPVAEFQARFYKASNSPLRGEAEFTVTIDNPSIVDILVDLNGNGVYDAGTDVVISNKYDAPGVYTVFWDGRRPNNVPVESGTPIRFIASLLFYPVHFPIYDMEQSLGLQLYHVRPGVSAEDKGYWDDSGLTDACNNAASGTCANNNTTASRRSVFANLTGSKGTYNSNDGLQQKRHTWWANGDYGFSQNRTINTWTGAYNEEIIREMIFNFNVDIDLKVDKNVLNYNTNQVTFEIVANHPAIVPVNPNQQAATDVFVDDVLPAGYTYVSHSTATGTYNPVTGKWTIGTLPVNTTATLTMTASVNPVGPYLNSAHIDGNENDVNPNNNTGRASIISITGNVYNDNNGTTNNSDGDLVNQTLGLVVNLYDASGNFITSTSVLPDGSYVFNNVLPGNGYQIQLSNYPGNTNPGGISANPGILPPDFTHVSSYDNVTPANGINVINVSAMVKEVSGIHFGINEPPAAVGNIETPQPNPGGTVAVDITDNFAGYDENNGIIVALTITAFPSNATSIKIGTVTYYATAGAIPGGCVSCAVFPANGVTVSANNDGKPATGNEIAIDPIDGAVTVVVPFTVTDNAGLKSTEAQLQIPFELPNTTNAVNDENSTWINTPVSGDVTTNDFDLEGNTRIFGSFLNQNGSGIPITSGTTVRGTDKNGNTVNNAGALTFNNDGTYIYTPAGGFTGNISVPYFICDNGNPVSCDTAVLEITVSDLPASSNSVIANNDEYYTQESPVNANVFVNDADPQGDSFIVTGVKQGNTTIPVGTPTQVSGVDEKGNPVANAGTLTQNANGAMTFIPALNFIGTITYNYTITDNYTAAPASDDAIVVIRVSRNENANRSQPVNNPPFAGDDFAYTSVNMPVNGNFSGNDKDPDNDPVSIKDENGIPVTINPNGPKNSVKTVTTEKGGAIEFFSDGTYTYTPPTDYIGPDKVVYEICDVTIIEPQPLCAQATIHLLAGAGLDISGNVLHDGNGMTDNNVNGLGTNIEDKVYAVLTDIDGKVIAGTLVKEDGSYEFINLPFGKDYIVLIDTLLRTKDEIVIQSTIPAGWVATGEIIGLIQGHDGAVNGKSTDINRPRTHIANINFGIQQPPLADTKLYNVANTAFEKRDSQDPLYPNEPGFENFFIIPTSSTYLTGNGLGGSLTGRDAEDCPNPMDCNTGKTFRFGTALPSTVVYYNYGGETGIRRLQTGDFIPDYEPENLIVAAREGSGMSDDPVGFTYSLVDNAGFPSAPVSYMILTESALPVELLFFTARAAECKVILSWSTASELNNDYFEVQKSTDATVWTTIGKVDGNSTTNYKNDYSFEDEVSQNAVIYYRLKQVDFDGTAEYHHTITVETKRCNAAQISLFPNPAKNILNIKVSNSDRINMHITIINAVGRILQSISTNNTLTPIDITGYPAGTYFLQINIDNGQSESMPFVIIK